MPRFCRNVVGATLEYSGAVMSKRFEISRGLQQGANLLRSYVDRARQPDRAEDGVIVLTNHRPEAAITLRGFTLLIAAFLIFKGVVIAYLGLDVYVEAIQKLQYGSLLEQAGAFIMSPDAISQAVAAQLLPIVH